MDVVRTFPDVHFFREDSVRYVQRVLHGYNYLNVVRIYSVSIVLLCVIIIISVCYSTKGY